MKDSFLFHWIPIFGDLPGRQRAVGPPPPAPVGLGNTVIADEAIVGEELYWLAGGNPGPLLELGHRKSISVAPMNLGKWEFHPRNVKSVLRTEEGSGFFWVGFRRSCLNLQRLKTWLQTRICGFSSQGSPRLQNRSDRYQCLVAAAGIKRTRVTQRDCTGSFCQIYPVLGLCVWWGVGGVAWSGE